MEEQFTHPLADSAADAAPAERAAFIRRTYLHLAAAILGFVALEAVFFVTGVAEAVVSVIQAGGKFSWFFVLAAFMGVSWIANRWAHSEATSGIQYLGLVVYVIAEALIFIPLLYVAAYFGGGADTILKAGVVTIGLLAGLTAVVFITRTDFSFLGSVLAVGGLIALAFIGASIVFGFSLGSVFAFVMVGFAATAILYSTSNVLHSYHPTQHVAASLSLFASVALLFWYILSIFSSDD